MMKAVALLSAALLLALPAAQACIFTWTRPEGQGITASNFTVAAAGECTYDHVRAGRDWKHGDAGCGWTCAGKSQSPINIPTAAASQRVLDPRLIANTNFGIASGLKVINLGHAVQVEWSSLQQSRGSVVVCGDKETSMYNLYRKDNPNRECLNPRRINVEPLQFHFHATSEHLLAGQSFMLELHIVTRLVPTGNIPMPKDCPLGQELCLAVFGVMYDIKVEANSKKGDPLIQRIVSALPKGCPEAGKECQHDMEGQIDLGGLLPGLKYYTYTGSLTTPPCAEGVMWHVFDTVKATMSEKQAINMQLALSRAQIHGHQVMNRLNNRVILPLNERNVFASV